MTIIITGKNTVLETIKAGRKIHEIYVLKGSNKDVVSEARKKNIKIKEID